MACIARAADAAYGGLVGGLTRLQPAAATWYQQIFSSSYVDARHAYFPHSAVFGGPEPTASGIGGATQRGSGCTVGMRCPKRRAGY
jgi:hypothetical protein